MLACYSDAFLLLVLVFAGLCNANFTSPTCALNSFPCPTPTWGIEWNLTRSSVCQPGGPGFSGNGPFDPLLSQPWGLVSLDWSVASNVWFNSGNPRNSTCEAVSIANCKALKAKGTASRCFIYHNMELALGWIESQSAVMYDPTKTDWFVQYYDQNGNKNGTIYNEPIYFGDQYFWDFTNPDAAAYFVNSIVNSVADPDVDGTFTDDVTGAPAEHVNMTQHVNMSAQQLEKLQIATQETSQWLIDTLVSKSKYNWQAFGWQDSAGLNPNKTNCLSFMREYCQPAYQAYPMMMTLNDTSPANKNQIVAGFLITRPPFAWLGWGWESDQRNWDPVFLLNTGWPTGLCEESAATPGVFSRNWTEGTVVLDCNTWTATLPFQ